MKTRLRILLAALLVSFGALTRHCPAFEIRAPATWAGESLGVLSGSFGGDGYLGTFELATDFAVLPGSFWVEANGSAFYAELGAGSSFSIVDQAAVQAALTSGVLDLTFQPLPGTVPVVRFLIPAERGTDSFAIVQQLANGTVISSPLDLSGYVMNWNGTWFRRGAATYDPSLPFWAMDLDP